MHQNPLLWLDRAPELLHSAPLFNRGTLKKMPENHGCFLETEILLQTSFTKQNGCNIEKKAYRHRQILLFLVIKKKKYMFSTKCWKKGTNCFNGWKKVHISTFAAIRIAWRRM